MTDRTAEAATLTAVLKACAPGDVVTFAGVLDVKALPARPLDAPSVRIKAAPGATLRGYAAEPATNLIFSGFEVPCALNRVGVGLWAPKGGWLEVEDCRFTGPGGLKAGNDSASGVGLVMMGCVRTRRCGFSGLFSGISVQGGIGHVIENCTFDDLWLDAIAAQPTETGYLLPGAPPYALRISRNTMTNFRGGPAHLDCVQLIRGALTLPCIIEDNVYIRGDGTAAQGVFSDSAPGPVIVRGNAFLGGAWQGISLTNPRPGTVIEGNFLQGWNVAATADGKIAAPWIAVDDPPGVSVGPNLILPNTAGGDRSALDAWLATRGASAPPQAPAPSPAPAPEPAPAPTAGPSAEQKIAAFKAAIADLLA